MRRATSTEWRKRTRLPHWSHRPLAVEQGKLREGKRSSNTQRKETRENISLGNKRDDLAITLGR